MTIDFLVYFYVLPMFLYWIIIALVQSETGDKQIWRYVFSVIPIVNILLLIFLLYVGIKFLKNE